MPSPKPLLNLQHISKWYEDDGAPRTDVLHEVDLTLQAGESLAIVGPSGCGKSTLLNLIAGLDRPSDGDLWLYERNLTMLPDDELAQLRAAQIGMVFQLHHLLPQLTVLENVLLPTLAPGVPKGSKADAPARARLLLDRVGLSARLGHRPGQLSGGERQRVAVVRALINEPVLLLADEPTGALDADRAAELADLLAEIHREQGVAMIMVTHSPALAARQSRVLTLREGHLEAAPAGASSARSAPVAAAASTDSPTDSPTTTTHTTTESPPA